MGFNSAFKGLPRRKLYEPFGFSANKKKYCNKFGSIKQMNAERGGGGDFGKAIAYV